MGAENWENKKEKSENALEEERILNFWEDNDIFKRSLEKPAPKGNFVFYDGPPFATGLPHYGHILAGTIKDVIPRYQTMRGKYVRRVWGWDCHGLPIENLIEKELGLNSKKDVEDYGVEEFNRAARESVLLYDREWKRIVPRLGRWIDMENAYKTMDTSYTESVFYSFRQLHEKGLLYKGFKSMHICPRCEATLSNFEVNQGYKDIKDISVTAIFKLKDEGLDELGLKGEDVNVLAWTTTPWTLPGNSALAVNPELDYALVKKDGSYYIVAKDRLDEVMGEGLEPEKIFKGKDLVGYSYEPLFDYFVDVDLHGDKEKGWRIYSADFVTTEEGTGIVHIAPAFGSDDYDLSLEHNIPFIQHIDMRGRFIEEAGELAGKPAKPKDDHTATDVEVIKILAGKKKLFAKEKMVHSYPHCWRCDTPLLNYATDSWFVAVSDIKDKLVKENEKVNWVPEHIGTNRFGEWLKEAKDWSVSRARFWGTPLPVWECRDCEEYFVAGSFEEITQNSNNQYLIMRHGEAESNVKDVLSSDPATSHHLTEKGKKQVADSAQKIANDPPDVIITSDVLRTKETAQIVAEACDIPSEDIVEEPRLRELDFGDIDLHPVKEYRDLFEDWTEGFEKPIPKGESYLDVKKRLGSLLDELEVKYAGKRILLISHNAPLWLLSCVARSLDRKETIDLRGDKGRDFIENAEVRELDHKILPHNENYEIDMHRPYIDSVLLTCSCGGVMKRVPYVFDTWYDSGSVPFAQIHYPFENKEDLEKKDSPYFPADFIAEGQDQTRGWFYTLLVLSTALYGQTPFKNVVVNGTVLAEDGKKMSKSLNNYPDPMDMVDRYGADSVRYTLLASPAVRAEDLAFSESRVDEVSKKLINRLMNVVSFYKMHEAGLSQEKQKVGEAKKLDIWMESRVMETAEKVTSGLDSYEINQAARPLMDLVDDLSTWYIRRSRDRFKEDPADSLRCLQVINETLKDIARLMAPITPFTAERVFEAVRSDGDPESVHLDEWPEVKEYDQKILDDFREVRRVISQGLEKRSEAGVRVRQPLRKLSLKELPVSISEDPELLQHICAEVNVKEVRKDPSLDSDISLDTKMTPELVKEGEIRDLVRTLQSYRKKEGFTSEEKAKILVETDDLGKDLLRDAASELEKTVKISEVSFGAPKDPYTFKIGDKQFLVEMKK